MIYLALGVAMAIAVRTLVDDKHGPIGDARTQHVVVFVVMPLMSVFAGFMGYFSLARRCTDAHLAARIWNSSPRNPQSNQLTQIIGFGSVGLSAVSQQIDGALRIFGFFAMWISVALIVSLLLFRIRHVHRREIAK